jgi:hypothetical protein
LASRTSAIPSIPGIDRSDTMRSIGSPVSSIASASCEPRADTTG